MSRPSHAPLGVLIPLLAGWMACASVQAQTLYGVNPFVGLAHEFTLPASGACTAPNTVDSVWLYTFPASCAGAPAAPVATGGLFNAIAVNRVADTVLITDGSVVEEYRAGNPAGSPAGTPVDAWMIPATVPPMGPILGMCMDAAGAVLYLTDGVSITGLGLAPGGCVAPTAVVPPFGHGLGVGVVLTDITFDPVTGGGTLWACGVAGGLGAVYNVVIGAGGVGPGGAFSSIFSAPVGIALDAATPVSAPLPAVAPHVYLTDGSTVAYIDTSTGSPSISPPFYSPITFGPTPGLLSGLAYAAHGVGYGTPAGNTKLRSAGQSTSPSSTLSLIVTNAPVPSSVFLLANFSFPGPTGYLCPPVWILFNPLYVDPAPPLLSVALGSATGSTLVFPTPIPAGVPTGLGVFFQFFMDTSQVGAGPWLATQGLAITIAAP